MLTQIQGLHHVTTLGRAPLANDTFVRLGLGLRRVKKTVNFDAPDVYHLYFGNTDADPGTILTYFPRPNVRPRKAGTGEVGRTCFAVGAIADWPERLGAAGATDVTLAKRFDQDILTFTGVDGDDLALIPNGGGDPTITGFHSVDLRLADMGPTRDLLEFMGYQIAGHDGDTTRMVLQNAKRPALIDLTASDLPPARQGGGAVHHIAFSVACRARQLEVREALIDAGYEVTEVRDRTYFNAIYFRSPGGVLFEVATDDPGFAVDEPAASLGNALRLPAQHEHLRQDLEETLVPLPDA
ncbi:MAG: ring-cleaving dioxygenase [Rhodobacteraceae bacterium]|nr:ring-cleaving dioxygenase [Paracoccaceae bacterium]